MYCRVHELRVDLEQAILDIGFQHQCSWQDLGRVLQAKADLLCWVFELTKTLQIHYVGIPDRGIVYLGGHLKSGSDGDYRIDFAKNIVVPNESRNTNPLHMWTTK
jgi:hypothetical protein